MAKLEPQIRKVFEEHNKKLIEQKKRLARSIEIWCHERIVEIKAHATAVTKHLDEQFQIQKQFLDRRRQNYLKEVTKPETANDTEQIQMLLKKAKDLIFQLDLFRETRQIDFLQVMTQEQLKDNNSNGSQVDDNKETQSRRESTEGNDTNAGNSTSARQKPLSTRTSASPRQSNQPSSETSPSMESNPSKTKDPQLTSGITNEDDTSNKCPVCFMIFSELMKKTDRERHANEHYDDN